MTRIYRAQHGLREPEILGLAADRWGRIWIAARDGLYLLRDEPAAPVIGGVAVIAGVDATIRPVSHDATLSLLRDRSGSIWMGGRSGLHHYKDWRLNVYLTDEKAARSKCRRPAPGPRWRGLGQPEWRRNLPTPRRESRGEIRGSGWAIEPIRDLDLRDQGTAPSGSAPGGMGSIGFRMAGSYRIANRARWPRM